MVKMKQLQNYYNSTKNIKSEKKRATFCRIPKDLLWLKNKCKKIQTEMTVKKLCKKVQAEIFVKKL